MSDTTRLRELEDRQAISDLLSRYCYLIASRDVDGVVDLFADDCCVEVLGREYAGEAGLRELYEASLTVDPKPCVHNQLLDDLTERSARGRAVFEIEQGPEGGRQKSTGCYEDHYVKSGEAWKFARRVFRLY
jgi:ketosteroid isomerase-like protein